MRGWRSAALAVSMLALVALGWGGVRIQRDVVGLQASVDARWSDVEHQLALQHDLLPRLVSVTRSHAGVDQAVYAKLAETRTRYLDAEPARRAAEAHAVDAAFAALLLAARRDPGLAADPGFREVCRQIAATHERVDADRQHYNQEAALLNARIGRLPWRLFADGFEPRPLYEPPSGPRSDPTLAAAL